MTTEVVETFSSDGTLSTLTELLESIDRSIGKIYGDVIYVTKSDGTLLSGARVEQETLSDGSPVYNLVLIF